MKANDQQKTEKNGYISIADLASTLQKSEEWKKFEAEIQAKMEVSPARHARQYDGKFLQISMELAGRIMVLRHIQSFLTPAKRYDANDLTTDEVDELIQRRAEEVYALYALQVAFDLRKAELDAAVEAEDASREK